METNVFLVLDDRRAKADGTFPVLLRIIHQRKPSQITTGVYVKRKDWDEEERKIKSSYRGSESPSRLNNYLQKKRNEAADLIFKLDEQKKLHALTVTELKALIEKKPKQQSFFSYGEELIQEMRKTHRHGNARVYEGTLIALKNFMGQRDLSFIQINGLFLKRFETHYLSKVGNTINGLAVYMRTIRAIYNQAIKVGLADKELYPFSAYSIQQERTSKRAIPMEYILAIEKLKIEKDSRLFNARNYFLASFYLRGASFTDVAMLKVKNIVDGRVAYSRQKTGTPYSIKITPEMQTLLELYTPGKKIEDYIFPIVKTDTPEGIYNQIVWARKRFNKRLKEIATLAGIQTNLTSYVSRHSFATRAKNLGVPVASISELLGHTSIKTTEIYLDSLPSDTLDEIHERITAHKKVKKPSSKR